MGNPPVKGLGFILYCCFGSSWYLAYKHVTLLSHVHFFVTPWIIACQTPLSMEFSRQEYWRGLGIFPSKRSNLALLHCRQTLCPLSHQGSRIGTEALFGIEHKKKVPQDRPESLLSSSTGLAPPDTGVRNQEESASHIHRVQ